MPQAYEYILAGGGSAGLALALHLVRSPLGERPILLIEPDAKERNDRTWCCWTTASTLVDPIRYHVWERLAFVSDNFRRVFALAPYRYQMVRGIDYYAFARRELAQHPNVTWLRGAADAVRDGADWAEVDVAGQTYRGRWVFDSRFIAQDFRPDTMRYHDVKQHFRGWVIETPTPAFDPQTATFFDFRTPQRGVMRFMYILPFTPQRALVEYTLFSTTLLPEEEYRAALREYLASVLKLPEYTIVEEESGLIPMTDQPFPRRGGQRILYTGTRGGRVKACTGFAFLRTQQDSAAIVASLMRHGHPFDLPTAPRRYAWFDAILLDVLTHEGHLAKPIYTALFKNNPIARLFRFLDEQGGWGEDLQVLASLPPGPFLRGWLRYKVLRRV